MENEERYTAEELDQLEQLVSSLLDIFKRLGILPATMELDKARVSLARAIAWGQDLLAYQKQFRKAD